MFILVYNDSFLAHAHTQPDKTHLRITQPSKTFNYNTKNNFIKKISSPTHLPLYNFWLEKQHEIILTNSIRFVLHFFLLLKRKLKRTCTIKFTNDNKAYLSPLDVYHTKIKAICHRPAHILYINLST